MALPIALTVFEAASFVMNVYTSVSLSDGSLCDKKYQLIVERTTIRDARFISKQGADCLHFAIRGGHDGALLVGF